VIRVGIVGAAGRMGKTLVAEVAEAEGMELVSACEHGDHPAIGADAGALAGVAALDVKLGVGLASIFADGAPDAVIDFTSPQSTVALAALCAEKNVALIIGTTGLDQGQSAAISEAARSTPIVWAPNMSVGVNVLLGLVKDAARQLGDGSYDIEVIEAHHKHKKDAPSGTAMRLVEVLAENTISDETLEQRLQHGREGLAPRRAKEIGVHAVRGGDIVGDHTVMFCTEGERVELSHRASSRRTFSRGAVRAVRWLEGKDAGLYDMQDVLGLKGR